LDGIAAMMVMMAASPCMTVPRRELMAGRLRLVTRAGMCVAMKPLAFVAVALVW
jgi:hypothetical protein